MNQVAVDRRRDHGQWHRPGLRDLWRPREAAWTWTRLASTAPSPRSRRASAASSRRRRSARTMPQGRDPVGRITGVTDIAACDDRELVVEAVPENGSSSSRASFTSWTKRRPRTAILASNTSVDLDHGHRRGHAAFGQGDRHALHEPGADHEARRGHPRPGHGATTDRSSRPSSRRRRRPRKIPSRRTTRASSATAC
jgi:hypothetical protein